MFVLKMAMKMVPVYVYMQFDNVVKLTEVC